MSQSIMPRGIKTVGGVAYISLYIPVDGRFIIARKMVVSNGFEFEFCTLTKVEEYERVWADPDSGKFFDVTEVDANLAVLCNQLSANTASAPLTEAQLHSHPLHVIIDNPDMAETPTGPATVLVGNFPEPPTTQHVTVDNPTTTVTIANPTTNPETGLAKNATLTDGSQKTQVTNFPATQAVTGPATNAELRATRLPVDVAFPTTQPVSGPLTDTQLRAAPFAVTVSFPPTQPVSGPLTDTQLRATPVPVSGFPTTYPVTGTFWQATQPVSIATMPTTPVTGTFWQTTQPISAAALPLPTGAATAAKQDAALTSLSAIQASVAAPALPSGGATSAKQDTGNSSLASIDTKLTGVSTAALQATLNNTVALASKQDVGNALLQTIANNGAGVPKASGGLPSKVVVANAASTTPTVIKNSPGQVYHIGIGNTSSSVVYVSFFNKATAPTSGDIPVEIHPIPAGQYVSIDYPLGNQYSTGIALTITSGITLLGVLTGLIAANQVVVNVAYM